MTSREITCSDQLPKRRLVATHAQHNHNHGEMSEQTPPAVSTASESLPPQNEQPQDEQQETDDNPHTVPLPEGARATALRVAYKRALSKSMSPITLANFSSCFPKLASANPRKLEMLHTAMTKHMVTRGPSELNLIFHRRKVVQNLNALDELLAEATERRRAAPEGVVPVAPSLLPPRDVVEAHLRPVLKMAVEREEEKLAETRRRNDIMMREIEEQRRIMKEFTAQLEESRAAFGQAVEEVVAAARAIEEEEMA